MSLDVLTAIWRDPPCKGGDLLCLLAIADNADENGYAWPSVETIARKAAMGERGAQKCLKNLAQMGLIRIEVGGGRSKTNAYQITTNGIGPQDGHKNPEQNTVNGSSPFIAENPEQPCKNPEPPFAKPRTPVHLNSQEPSVEPSETDLSRKAKIPQIWQPCPEMLAYARKVELTEDETAEIAHEFHGYWLERKDQGARKTERGWRQTWNNHIRNVAPSYKRNRPKNTGIKGTRYDPSLAERAAERVEEMDFRQGDDPSQPLLPARHFTGGHGGGAG